MEDDATVQHERRNILISTQFSTDAHVLQHHVVRVGLPPASASGHTFEVIWIWSRGTPESLTARPTSASFS